EDVSLAFGAEYRDEEFTIKAGQVESYIDGGLGAQGFSTSTNGFPGFSPAISGDFSRSNYAIYADLEWDASDDVIIATAIRYEDFEDFGTTTNFKLGGNWQATDQFGMRGTFSTGFKAPTPGQLNASNISTQFVGGMLTNQGVIPANNPVAQLPPANAVPLQPEESTSFTAGVFFALGPVDVTIDYFNIQVDDRLNLSSQFTIGNGPGQIDPAAVAALAAQGIDTSDITSFSFFTNQFDTETKGFDIVGTASTEWSNGAITDWNLSLNTTDTEVIRRNAALLDNTRVRLIEEGTPDTRWNFTANTTVGQFRGLVRLSHYGEFFDNEAGGAVFDDTTLVDLEFGYDINASSTVALGARNVFDEQGCSQNECGTYPSTVLGLQYSQFSPFGFNGAYWYGRYQYSFGGN
ncbi:MAG: TonB-dependent receptor, partial [Gammaproteobacteria bacterium]|nr:TonB-dependent receptor [Gammaproteobacteria bacterium]